jgi:Tfp pilus assembly protein PilO
MARTRKWTMGTAAVVVLILLAGWFLLVSPKRASADELRASTATQEATNLTLASQLEALKVQKAGLPAEEAKLATIRQQIPDNPALPPLIRSLSSIAKKTGVTLQLIAPAPPTANASPAVAPAGPPATGVVPQLQTISLTINFFGTYANVELFLNHLEMLKRSFLVTGLQMSPGTATTNGVTKSGSPTLAVIMQARAFNVTTIGLAPAPAAAGSTSGSTTAAQ